jgi:hypothetical protein
MDGVMDDLRVYNYALSQSDIAPLGTGCPVVVTLR